MSPQEKGLSLHDLIFKSYQITALQANIGYSSLSRTHPHYLVGWPSLLVAWGEEPAEEPVEIGSEEDRTAVAPWAAGQVLGEAVEEQEEEEEQKEQEGILPAGSWAAPSPRRADTVPSAAPRGGASAGAAESCRSSTTWQLRPRSTRSQRNRPERCRCPVTSPWQWRDRLRSAPLEAAMRGFRKRNARQEMSRCPRYPGVDVYEFSCQVELAKISEVNSHQLLKDWNFKARKFSSLNLANKRPLVTSVTQRYCSVMCCQSVPVVS